MNDLQNIFESYKQTFKKPSDGSTEVVVEDHSHNMPCEDSNLDMAKSETFNIIHCSNELFNLLGVTEKMEPWMLSKIVKASEFISSVRDVLRYSDFENTMLKACSDVQDASHELHVVDTIKNMLSGENERVNEEVLKQIIFNLECLKESKKY